MDALDYTFLALIACAVAAIVLLALDLLILRLRMPHDVAGLHAVFDARIPHVLTMPARRAIGG